MKKPAQPAQARVLARKVLTICCLITALVAVQGGAVLPSSAFAGTITASDNFARANGSLGPNWTDMTLGGLAIANQQVVGTNSGGNSGDIRTAETYDSDQYSQVQVSSTPLSGTQWIGPAVRAQAGGQDLYVGIYYWNNGSPELMMFLRNNGNWAQLGSTYPTGALAAGTQLTLAAVGSTLTFADNGTVVISATDTNLTGGAPGIMANGLAPAGTWSGGDADPAFSVSGSVSGLSGTVVLQDNNSDTLSVSANGSFTFDTLLANGASYNVTVLTNPTGQDCSVTGGSGAVSSANVTGVAVSCTAAAPVGSGGVASDNFARANGSLGPNWTAMTGGGLAIANQEVAGTNTNGNSGDTRTAESYTSNQYSQVQVTSTPLTGTQWIGPVVRAQAGGQDGYVGIYYWDNGSPELMLFLRDNGNWTTLGAHPVSALAAGTQLTLTAVGSTLTFSDNGTAMVTATDTTLTGGAPGIMANGLATAGNWSGADATGSSSGSGPSGSGSTTYSVGGTVSGLSGTVVLQDNGTGNLSVSANGSFTFASQLSTGAAYNVTVFTNPTGQACSVSGGSGTVASANLTSVAVTCAATAQGPDDAGTITASDNFARANGSLGPNWTDMTLGGLAIANQQVVGTNSGGNSGDIRTAETYDSDQYSQVQVSSTPLSGTQWIGPAVRAQAGGQDLYVGIYYWNNGSPELMMFLRNNGNWAQLGSTYPTGALAAGTQLTLAAVGSTLTFADNGTVVISATDTNLTGGAPGIMANGLAPAGTWSGGDADPAFSVSGSVSGLSGTVVLQDNNSDTLSVSANGSFTFDTLLANGASYNVTVLTNPTGQDCSVTGGSGAVSSANVTGVAVSCTAAAPVGSGGVASDNFARANGSLGPNWTAMTGGGLAIANQEVAGTNTNGNSGDTRTAESYTSNQYSQVQVTSTPLTGTQWIGPVVRAQAGGQDGYVGIYYWDNGSPELMLFLRDNGNWTTLGAHPVSALAAGTQLTLTAVGSTLTFSDNGTAMVTATDTTLTGGAPGIMANGLATAGNWSGADATGSSSGSGPSGSGSTTYSVGGTVSGLSGTVVLQDNGTGNLSVSANGSFTFASQLSTGAAYNVTVFTNPTGQACSVSGGSGTVASANLTSVAVTCAATSSAPGASGVETDNFARANGSLGPNWTAMTDGGLTISNQAVAGTNASSSTGDIRTGESYSNDQFSQVQLTSTQLTGSEWIGPVVRAQAGGQNAYVGIYFWQNGSPELMLFLRHNGNWTTLGSSVTSPLSAGTQLRLTAVGSTLSFSENGLVVITASDPTLTGGAPGIMASGLATATEWSGADADPAYSVSGTVSGLSGTVVLQDNGADNMSVSANGAFTFPTLLAPGSNYNVTVLTNPSGQNCSVSGGSGPVTSANVTGASVTCGAAPAGGSGGVVSDNFARANGSLGPNWTAMTGGGLAIANYAVSGTNSSGDTGDIRTGESYSSNQFSQVELTSTQLTGGQWVGPAVRSQAGGQDAYVGIYYWDNGSPEMMLFLRDNGNWTQLGSYSTSPLAAGTQVTLTVVGSTLALSVNGIVVVTTSDPTLTGGAPGIMASGLATATDWSGGNSGFQMDYQSTDANGVQYYDAISANNGYGAQVVRVLRPTHPAAGVAHNFLFVLPVEAGLGNSYGDGLATLEAADAQDQYNLTIVEPTFDMEPWYANSPSDPNLQYETFVADELVPWVDQNLGTTGTEQNWLIGFSKSGYGAQDLILKYPNLFTAAASWDFPADMSSYNQYGSGAATNYGTQANFSSNYQLTHAFVAARDSSFLSANRIWLGGYSLYQQDMSDYAALLTSQGVKFTQGPSQALAHRWDSGWMPAAVAALYQDSLSLPPGP